MLSQVSHSLKWRANTEASQGQDTAGLRPTLRPKEAEAKMAGPQLSLTEASHGDRI